MANPYNAISPIDGRYRKQLEPLSNIFSESALMRYRTKIEIEYLIALNQEKKFAQGSSAKKLRPLTLKQIKKLRTIYSNFSQEDCLTVKTIEETINHDVKAVEYFLRKKFQTMGLSLYQSWIHFGLTSEDVNNLAYALMWQDGIHQIYLPVIARLHTQLTLLARRYAKMSFLGMTHGQPATPTTLGKEFGVYAVRLKRQIEQLQKHKLHGKLSGATGTFGAHALAYPEIDWIKLSGQFILSLELEPNLHTTQIESCDSLAESYHILVRINTILLDLSRDMWQYIARGIFEQKAEDEEVGSSTMPHKVNPIQFENAEGNLGIANAYLNHMTTTLPVSRMQRDLSGSTLIRNQGVALAHSLLATQNILKGLERLTVDMLKIRQELEDHWEVLAEAVQTVLRKHGYEDPYKTLKQLTRGKSITKQSLQKFIGGLDIPQSDKKKLLELSPHSYIGLSEKLVQMILRRKELR